jgi:hypothetical protein
LLVFFEGIGKKRVVGGGFWVVNLWCCGVLTWWIDGRFVRAKIRHGISPFL